jgi:hypothetical protein
MTIFVVNVKSGQWLSAPTVSPNLMFDHFI